MYVLTRVENLINNKMDDALDIQIDACLALNFEDSYKRVVEEYDSYPDYDFTDWGVSIIKKMH